MRLSISDENILRVNGEFLQARNTAPDELFDILVKARWRIEQAIEDMYQRYASKPELTVRRGSVWVMRLAPSEKSVISAAGLARDSTSQEDRGVFINPSEVLPKYLPYWQAVQRAGLAPEARTANRAAGLFGFCLLAYIKGSR